MAQYDVGDLLRVTGTFDDGLAPPTNLDPTTVRFQYTTPDRVETTLTYGIDVAVVKDSTGTYHVDLDLNQAGPWHYRFFSTGTGQASERGAFDAVSYTQ